MQWLLFISLACLVCSASRIALTVGVVLQVTYLAVRSVSLGRLPLLGPHDTLVFFSCSVALVAVLSSCTHSLRGCRWYRIVSGIAAAMAGLAALCFPPLGIPLPSILDTLWFEMHVVLAFLGYALFMAGAVLCAGYVVRRERTYLEFSYIVNLTGWVFFSVSMIAGGIWGYYAWGTYWLWTPKEFWTSILWLYYALVLHLRLNRPRRDRLTAWLSIAGAAVMVFTYLGVSMLMKSSHSF